MIELKAVAQDDRCLRVSLAGELDFYTAEHVGPRLHRIAESEPPNLILDLSGLSFCDSSGIDFLLGLERHCRAAGTRLLLCDVPPPVAQSMRVLAADRDLKLVAS
ncbi:STAS domain-containing protein [Streptomyces roseus]|uniref:STAS domain-containing protein n=1 Tax=Streptomyces roseus TaxID=66430 RepID=UPI003818EAA8